MHIEELPAHLRALSDPMKKYRADISSAVARLPCPQPFCSPRARLVIVAPAAVTLCTGCPVGV